MVQRTCHNTWCKQSFEVTDDDLAFLDRLSPVFAGKKESIPLPTLCPDCRQQRRLAWRNEMKLYHRVCDQCGKETVSLYPPHTPFPVFHNQEWWSDGWDPSDYGMTFDFTKPLFTQLAVLQEKVPRVTIFNKACENADFANHSRAAKNCYYGCVVIRSENVMYSRRVFDSTDLCDVLNCYSSELCYETVDCNKCYHCTFSHNCTNCTDCGYCYECIGCRNCYLCSNLRNRQYHILNVGYSPDEYKRLLAEYEKRRPDEIRSIFNELLGRTLRRNVIQKNCDQCNGDCLEDSKDSQGCFYGIRLESCRYCFEGEIVKDCMDCHSVGSGAELDYETNGDSSGYRLLFSYVCYGSKETLYCDLCSDCSNCFACIGLKRKKFCVLNKQYTEEEYGDLVPKIIAHLRSTGEWGESLPVSLSPFSYNETVAQEYFSLTKEEVLKRGWKWRDQKEEMPKVSKIIPASKLPGSIDDIPDDILNWAINCEATNRPFKIIKQELDFYRKMKLPIPHLHPDERHRRRMALRNPRKLWVRPCMKCQKEMQTTYQPSRPEIVYCEECYLKEVY